MSIATVNTIKNAGFDIEELPENIKRQIETREDLFITQLPPEKCKLAQGVEERPLKIILRSSCGYEVALILLPQGTGIADHSHENKSNDLYMQAGKQSFSYQGQQKDRDLCEGNKKGNEAVHGVDIEHTKRMIIPVVSEDLNQEFLKLDEITPENCLDDKIYRKYEEEQTRSQEAQER